MADAMYVATCVDGASSRANAPGPGPGLGFANATSGARATSGRIREDAVRSSFLLLLILSVATTVRIAVTRELCVEFGQLREVHREEALKFALGVIHGDIIHLQVQMLKGVLQLWV